VAEDVLRAGRLLCATGEGVDAELPGEVALVAGVVAPADEGLSLEVRPHLTLVSPILQAPLEVVVAAEVAVELPRDDLLLRLRLGRVPDVEVVCVRVDAPREANVGTVPGGARHAVDVPTKCRLVRVMLYAYAMPMVAFLPMMRLPAAGSASGSNRCSFVKSPGALSDAKRRP